MTAEDVYDSNNRCNTVFFRVILCSSCVHVLDRLKDGWQVRSELLLRGFFSKNTEAVGDVASQGSVWVGAVFHQDLNEIVKVC